MRLLAICGEAEDSKEAFISTNLGGLDASWKRTESAVTEGNRKICTIATEEMGEKGEMWSTIDLQQSVGEGNVVGQAREKACCQRRKEDGNEIRSDGSCFFRRCYYCSDCNKLARNAAGGELRHRKPVGESHPPRSGVDGHFGGSAEGKLVEGADDDEEDNKNKNKCL
ncbi:hypothetical protein B296_00027501 [Ensete ventricosum]|uniref:Uncharacterized protein n=1 Tax=Ensete ventricosum TaxID=4639 RepID=A0A426ZJH8_ENSVE|nr:hypothetical protein B296_00027501 [Ensete ventricosum]